MGPGPVPKKNQPWIVLAAAITAWGIRFGETLDPANRRPLRVRPTIDAFRRVVTCRRTVLYASALLFADGAFLIFLGSTQQVFDVIYGRADQFAVLFAASAIVFAAALAQRVGSHHPVFCMAQLMTSGVFDRFPDIKFYFAESNIAWLPWAMFTLDDNLKLFGPSYGITMKMKPSEYIEKHCHFGIVRDPIGLAYHDRIPMDNVMFGSDFPHSVGSYPKSQEFIDEAFAVLGPEIKRKILLETPAAYYGLDLDADITETPAA